MLSTRDIPFSQNSDCVRREYFSRPYMPSEDSLRRGMPARGAREQSYTKIVTRKPPRDRESARQEAAAPSLVYTVKRAWIELLFRAHVVALAIATASVGLCASTIAVGLIPHDQVPQIDNSIALKLGLLAMTATVLLIIAFGLTCRSARSDQLVATAPGIHAGLVIFFVSVALGAAAYMLSVQITSFDNRLVFPGKEIEVELGQISGSCLTCLKQVKKYRGLMKTLKGLIPTLITSATLDLVLTIVLRFVRMG